MEKREKTEPIHLVANASHSRQREDYTRTQIISRKISTKFFADKEQQDLKLRHYQLMIQHTFHEEQYLNICKYYLHVYDTPLIMEDEAKWKDVLHNIIYFTLS